MRRFKAIFIRQWIYIIKDKWSLLLLALTPFLSMCFLYYARHLANIEAAFAVLSFTFAYVLALPALLEERKQGTLEKTLISPVHRTQVVLGSFCSFAVFVGAQILLMLALSFFWIGFPSLAYLWQVFLALFAEALAGLSIGMFAASIAQNNFQAFQLALFIIVPQILLSGILPIRRFPGWLQQTAFFTPMYNGTEIVGSLTSGLPVPVDANFGYLLLILVVFLLLDILVLRIASK